MLDAIVVGPEAILAHRHTIKHFRKELWVRNWKTLLFLMLLMIAFPEKAMRKSGNLSSHQVPMIDEDKQKEMDKIRRWRKNQQQKAA